MTSTGPKNTRQLLDSLRAGLAQGPEAAWLRDGTATEFANELRSLGFAVAIQDRSIGKKWEASFARSCEWRCEVVLDASGLSVKKASLPVYRDCILLEAEAGRLSSLSWLESIALEPASADADVILTTGRGCKLEFDRDHWGTTDLDDQRVVLPRSFLDSRRWKTDLPGSVFPNERKVVSAT
jgi:hypothetical protein